jgi:hypothetical protein
MAYNLFIEHQHLLQAQKGKVDANYLSIGTGWENDFTNMLTFYFRCDPEALDYFCHLVLGEKYEKSIGIEAQYITSDGMSK